MVSAQGERDLVVLRVLGHRRGSNYYGDQGEEKGVFLEKGYFDKTCVRDRCPRFSPPLTQS